jgi:hypothetical protein
MGGELQLPAVTKKQESKFALSKQAIFNIKRGES